MYACTQGETGANGTPAIKILNDHHRSKSSKGRFPQQFRAVGSA